MQTHVHATERHFWATDWQTHKKKLCFPQSGPFNQADVFDFSMLPVHLWHDEYYCVLFSIKTQYFCSLIPLTVLTRALIMKLQSASIGLSVSLHGPRRAKKKRTKIADVALLTLETLFQNFPPVEILRLKKKTFICRQKADNKTIRVEYVIMKIWQYLVIVRPICIHTGCRLTWCIIE